MWIKLSEIVDWNNGDPKTNPVYIKDTDLALIRPAHGGTEVRVRDTWIYVTETIDYIMDYNTQSLLNENL